MWKKKMRANFKSFILLKLQQLIEEDISMYLISS